MHACDSRRTPVVHPALPTLPAPVRRLCAQAVKRWFEDTYAEATRGDVKQQALLGQMYAEGYGCEKDDKAAQEWTDRAAARGYRMKGVYCEL
jgi:TPR repeat protein